MCVAVHPYYVVTGFNAPFQIFTRNKLREITQSLRLLVDVIAIFCRWHGVLDRYTDKPNQYAIFFLY